MPPGSPRCTPVTGAPSVRQADRLAIFTTRPVSFGFVDNGTTGNATG